MPRPVFSICCDCALCVCASCLRARVRVGRRDDWPRGGGGGVLLLRVRLCDCDCGSSARAGDMDTNVARPRSPSALLRLPIFSLSLDVGRFSCSPASPSPFPRPGARSHSCPVTPLYRTRDSVCTPRSTACLEFLSTQGQGYICIYLFEGDRETPSHRRGCRRDDHLQRSFTGLQRG